MRCLYYPKSKIPLFVSLNFLKIPLFVSLIQKLRRQKEGFYCEDRRRRSWCSGAESWLNAEPDSKRPQLLQSVDTTSYDFTTWKGPVLDALGEPQIKFKKLCGQILPVNHEYLQKATKGHHETFHITSLAICACNTCGFNCVSVCIHPQSPWPGHMHGLWAW